jgi:hypothetical protein
VEKRSARKEERNREEKRKEKKKRRWKRRGVSGKREGPRREERLKKKNKKRSTKTDRGVFASRARARAQRFLIIHARDSRRVARTGVEDKHSSHCWILALTRRREKKRRETKT